MSHATPPAEALAADPVQEYLDLYEFAADSGSYVPSASERLLIEDALRGWEHARPAPHPSKAMALLQGDNVRMAAALAAFVAATPDAGDWDHAAVMAARRRALQALNGKDQYWVQGGGK